MKFFERISAGAGVGGMIGAAVGTLLTGTLLMIPGVNIAIAPVALLAVAEVAVPTVTVSLGALGTVIGGTAGAVDAALDSKKNGGGE